MQEKLKKFLSYGLPNVLGIIIGISLIANSLIILSVGYDPSKWFSALFGGALLVYIVLTNLFRKRIRWLSSLLNWLFVLFLVSFIIVEALIFSGAKQEAKQGDVIIVLGAGLFGDRPGPQLSLRLDIAYDFLLNNPEALCVLSGGQGADEVVSEAEAMTNYMLAKGLEPRRIIAEDKSTNTLENFANSKVILDEYFAGKDYEVVYVTNTFHAYRSGLIAKKTGLKAGGLSAPTLRSSALNYYLREYCSLLVYWLFR